MRLPARAAGARAALLAALEQERLTGFRASRELAWVVFPAPAADAASLEVLHVPDLGAYRVVAHGAGYPTGQPALVLGEFEGAEAAAACVAAALLPDVR